MTNKEKEIKTEEIFLKYQINTELFNNGDVINAYKAGVFDGLCELENLLKEVYNQAIDDAANRAYSFYIERSGEIVGPDYKDELLLLKK